MSGTSGTLIFGPFYCGPIYNFSQDHLSIHHPANEEGDFIAFEVRLFVQMLVDLDTPLLESRMQAIRRIGASTITMLAVALQWEVLVHVALSGTLISLKCFFLVN